MNKYIIQNATIETGGKFIKILFNDNKEARFLFKWLKDHSPEFIHPTSFQRMFDSTNISESLRIINLNKLENGNKLQIDWNDKTSTIFHSHWIRSHSYEKWAREERNLEFTQNTHSLHWNKSILKNKINNIDANE